VKMKRKRNHGATEGHGARGRSRRREWASGASSPGKLGLGFAPFFFCCSYYLPFCLPSLPDSVPSVSPWFFCRLF